jgi:hypothetical protein
VLTLTVGLEVIDLPPQFLDLKGQIHDFHAAVGFTKDTQRGPHFDTRLTTRQRSFQRFRSLASCPLQDGHGIIDHSAPRRGVKRPESRIGKPTIQTGCRDASCGRSLVERARGQQSDDGCLPLPPLRSAHNCDAW